MQKEHGAKSGEKKPFAEPTLSVEDLSRALFEANRSLAKVNLELRESEKKRHEVVAGLAHDLRQPLAEISGYAEYLLEVPGHSPAERESALRGVMAKVGLMRDYIAELLLLSNLDARADRPLEARPLPLGPLLEEFFYQCAESPRYAESDLHLQLAESFSARAMLDAKLVVRLLENLFGNALRYARGRPHITLGAYQREKEIFVFVADKGIGVPAESLEKIFERSYSLGDMPESHGLGLSIAKAIAEKHGGRIWCESTRGEGSVFTFSLPALP